MFAKTLDKVKKSNQKKLLTKLFYYVFIYQKREKISSFPFSFKKLENIF